jgi:hypothetical protein
MLAADPIQVLLEDLRAIRTETMAVLREARASGANDLAMKAIARLERQIELAGRLAGELQDAPSVKIQLSQEWIDLRNALLKALEPHPAARSAVVEVLKRDRG